MRQYLHKKGTLGQAAALAERLLLTLNKYPAFGREPGAFLLAGIDCLRSDGFMRIEITDEFVKIPGMEFYQSADWWEIADAKILD